MTRTEFKTLMVKDRKAWRAWLAKNHAKLKEIWFIFYKKHTGKQTISYEDAVQEALCFGWIDSTVRTIDDERYMQLFTPRKSGSNWSDLNKRRVKMLIEQGIMAEAGLRKIEEAKKNGSWKNLDAVEKLKVPLDLSKALFADKKAKDNFTAFSPSRKKAFLYWINSAKAEATRARRVAESIRLIAANKMPGI
jgi:uncharacterized protein YdeI (YjbR/CyaY-like superfamily)